MANPFPRDPAFTPFTYDALSYIYRVAGIGRAKPGIKRASIAVYRPLRVIKANGHHNLSLQLHSDVEGDEKERPLKRGTDSALASDTDSFTLK